MLSQIRVLGKVVFEGDSGEDEFRETARANAGSADWYIWSESEQKWGFQATYKWISPRNIGNAYKPRKGRWGWKS